ESGLVEAKDLVGTGKVRLAEVFFFFCVSSSLSQFDDFEPKEKTKKLSFFNWWTFSIFFGTLFANTILLYVQDNVGWRRRLWAYNNLVAISILIFLVGTPFYRHKVPTGSPFTSMSRVLVATIRKWMIPVPSDPKELYELDMAEYAKKQKYRIDSTPSLRFLNKVFVKAGSSRSMDTKYGNPSLGDNNTNDMHASDFDCNISTQDYGSSRLTPFLSSKVQLFAEIMRKWTKNLRGITLLQRMGMGFIFHILVMVSCISLTEMRRLGVAKDHGVMLWQYGSLLSWSKPNGARSTAYAPGHCSYKVYHVVLIIPGVVATFINSEKNELRDEKQRLKAEKEKPRQVKAMTSQPSFMPHPYAIPTAFAPQAQARQQADAIHRLP
ncbi:hypothetical protein IFM89_022647, partial [Coptis chinensis]